MSKEVKEIKLNNYKIIGIDLSSQPDLYFDGERYWQNGKIVGYPTQGKLDGIFKGEK